MPPEATGDTHGSLTVRQRVAASSLGGLLTAATMTPFDVVKTRLQAQSRPGASLASTGASRCFLYCNGLMDLQLCAVNACDGRSGVGRIGRESMVPNFCRHQYYTGSTYQGSWDAAIKIARSEGPLALWRGLSASLALTVPGTVIYFTTLDLLKWRLGYRPLLPGNRSKDWVPPLAAGAARVTAVLCLSPLELARTKMQAEGLGWSAVGRAAAYEVRRSGLLALWRGLPPTLIRDVPFSAIYWAAYDGLRARLLATRAAAASTDAGSSVLLTGPEAAGFGCIAAGLAGLATHPFDVLKTHRQVEFAGGLGGSTAGAAAVGRAPGTLEALRRLLARSPALLFSGLAPRLLKVVPASAVMVASFELLKNEFSERNRRAGGFAA